MLPLTPAPLAPSRSGTIHGYTNPHTALHHLTWRVQFRRVGCATGTAPARPIPRPELQQAPRPCEDTPKAACAQVQRCLCSRFQGTIAATLRGWCRHRCKSVLPFSREVAWQDVDFILRSQPAGLDTAAGLFKQPAVTPAAVPGLPVHRPSAERLSGQSAFYTGFAGGKSFKLNDIHKFWYLFGCIVLYL